MMGKWRGGVGKEREGVVFDCGLTLRFDIKKGVWAGVGVRPRKGVGWVYGLGWVFGVYYYSGSGLVCIITRTNFVISAYLGFGFVIFPKCFTRVFFCQVRIL